LGLNPHGYITYTRDRRVVVLVLKTDRPKPAALVPTDKEKLALYDSMFAYAGTYTVDAEKVVHHIDMSWNQSWTGTSQIRFFRLEGDRLTYVGAPARNPMNGRDCVHRVVFQRSAGEQGRDRFGSLWQQDHQLAYDPLIQRLLLARSVSSLRRRKLVGLLG